MGSQCFTGASFHLGGWRRSGDDTHILGKMVLAVGGRPPFLTRWTSPRDLFSAPIQYRGWFSQSKAPRESKDEATMLLMTQAWESHRILPTTSPW